MVWLLKLVLLRVISFAMFAVSSLFMLCFLIYVIVMSVLSELDNSVEAGDRMRRKAVIKAVRIIRRSRG